MSAQARLRLCRQDLCPGGWLRRKSNHSAVHSALCTGWLALSLFGAHVTPPTSAKPHFTRGPLFCRHFRRHVVLFFSWIWNHVAVERSPVAFQSRLRCADTRPPDLPSITTTPLTYTPDSSPYRLSGTFQGSLHRRLVAGTPPPAARQPKRHCPRLSVV